jgi:hypothetical protein
MLTTTCVCVIVSLVLWSGCLLYRHVGARRLPYPPGPRRCTILGNLLTMPQKYFWLTYTEWAKTYGDLVYLKVLDKHILVLNSIETARELLEKRSSVYSDRPRLPMIGEL